MLRRRRARGAVAGWVLAAVLGTGRTLLLPLVGAALSMWLGLVLRRREPLGRGVSAALGVGNTLAVVLLLPMLSSYTSGSPGFSDEAAMQVPGYPSQVVANGEPVQNLYAYDAAGNVTTSGASGFTVDNTAPTVAVTGGPDGQTFGAGSTQTWLFSMSDSTSGLAHPQCSVEASGSPASFSACSGLAASNAA